MRQRPRRVTDPSRYGWRLVARPDLVVTLLIANKQGNEYCDGETTREACNIDARMQSIAHEIADNLAFHCGHALDTSWK